LEYNLTFLLLNAAKTVFVNSNNKNICMDRRWKLPNNIDDEAV